MDKYIHYTSHHHPRIKTGIIRCLKIRAEKICDPSTRNNELAHLKRVFKANGYPQWVITQALRPHVPSAEEGATQQGARQDDSQKKPLLYLPYVLGISEPIQHLCHHLGIRTVFKTQGTLRQIMMKVKTQNDRLKKKGVVYRIPCKHCNKVYVGETGRTVQKRIAEHKTTVRRGDRNNGVVVHAWGTHNMKWTGRRWRLSLRRDTIGEGGF